MCSFFFNRVEKYSNLCFKCCNLCFEFFACFFGRLAHEAINSQQRQTVQLMRLRFFVMDSFADFGPAHPLQVTQLEDELLQLIRNRTNERDDIWGPRVELRLRISKRALSISGLDCIRRHAIIRRLSSAGFFRVQARRARSGFRIVFCALLGIDTASQDKITIAR